MVSKISVCREKGFALFGHRKGGAAHALHSSRDVDPSVSYHDRMRRLVYRLQPRAAQPVHGSSRHLYRETCKQQRHPRDIAIVLPRLVPITEEHVLDLIRIDVVSLDEAFDQKSREIVGADGGRIPPYFPMGVRTLSTMTASWRGRGIFSDLLSESGHHRVFVKLDFLPGDSDFGQRGEFYPKIIHASLHFEDRVLPADLFSPPD